MNRSVPGIWSFAALVAACALVAGTSLFHADAAPMATKITAQLVGAREVPPKQTMGTGTFQGTIAASDKSISYRLTFSDLTTRATMGHIHLGARGVNGPIVVWLCGGGGRPSCPAGGGTVTGTITAANVLPAGGIKRGDLAGLIKVITAGNTYVNVHTTKNPAGEIRGQVEIVM
jgi:hypothetical protein